MVYKMEKLQDNPDLYIMLAVLAMMGGSFFFCIKIKSDEAKKDT